MIIPFHGSKSKAAEAEAEAGAECGSQYSDDASVWSMGLDHPPPYTSSATLTASGYAPAIASASATAKAYGIFPQYTTHDQPVLLSLKRDRLLSSRTDVTILRGPGTNASKPVMSYTGLPVLGDLKAMARRNQVIVLSDAQGTALLSLHHAMYSFKGWVAVQPGTFDKKIHAASLGALADCETVPPDELFHVMKRSGLRFRSALVLPNNLGGGPVQCDIRTRRLKMTHHKIKDPQGSSTPLVLIKERSGIKTDALVEVAPHFDIALAVALAIVCTQQTLEMAGVVA